MEQRQIVFVSVIVAVTALVAGTAIVSVRRSRRACKKPVLEPQVQEPQDAEPVVKKPVVKRSRYFTRSQAPRQQPQVNIISNSGAGDCMFICFKQALFALNKRTTVKEMRRQVAESVTQDTFDTLKVIHDTALDDMDFDLIKDYGFMNGVDDLAQLRKRMMSRTYYGDDMALPVLEKYAGLNAIVIKSRKLQQRADPVIEGAPFIVLVLENEHYELASFNGHRVFFQYPDKVIQLLTV